MFGASDGKNCIAKNMSSNHHRNVNEKIWYEWNCDKNWSRLFQNEIFSELTKISNARKQTFSHLQLEWMQSHTNHLGLAHIIYVRLGGARVSIFISYMHAVRYCIHSFKLNQMRKKKNIKKIAVMITLYYFWNMYNVYKFTNNC